MSEQFDDRDPSQLIPPYVDSGMKIRGHRASDLWYGLPGAAVTATGLGTFLFGLPGTVPLTAIGGSLAAIGPTFAARAGEETTGVDMLRSPIRYKQLQQDYPMTNEDAGDVPEHGVVSIRKDGTALMEDGRVIGLVRVHGQNTDTATKSELQTLISSLSTRIDEHIDFDWRYYSTTTEYDTDEITQKYRDAAYSERYGGDEWKTARELLHDISEWYEEVEAPRWDARQWRHYVVVSVKPWEVNAPDSSEGLFPSDGLLSYFSDDNDDEMEDAEEEKLRIMGNKLDKRLETLERVFGSMRGVETERIGPAENALIHSQYWSGVDHNFDNADQIRDGRLENILSAPSYDFTDDYMRVGNQYARTYWISEWPVEPEPGFLNNLHTERGIDLDVTIRVRKRDKEDTEYELEHEITEIDADIEEREDATDISAITEGDDMESYVKAYKLLHHTSVRPWDIDGYITVRAGNKEALDEVERKINEGIETKETIELDVAKQNLLEEKSDELKNVAESTPAGLTLLSPDTRQRDLFISGSPTGLHVYDQVSWKDRFTMSLGGTLGAMFPGLSTEIRDEDGVEWGRKKQDGGEVKKNPFGDGVAHALFIGETGSGKTYSTLQRVIRWWLAGEDRTLIMCDTFGDFEGVTDLLNGDHVVLGGEQTINPLEMKETPEHARRAGLDSFGMKIDEVAAFLSGVLREQGVDAGDYMTLIKETAQITYRRAGIYPNDLESHGKQSPTMDGYLDVLSDIAENPDEVTISESKFEHDTVKENAAVLLRKLSGFQQGREYEHLVGGSQADITPGGVSYLDLQQMESQGAVGKSVMLQLMLGKVYQAVKEAPGETLFLIDEAHYLLHNEETVEWLQRATRHWRHYDAGVWFASQQPSEFVSGEGDSDGHQDTIRGQAATIQFTSHTELEFKTAKQFGMNKRQHEFIKQKATPGRAGLGYSESLIKFDNVEGWVRTQVRPSNLEDIILSYDPNEDGAFDEYIEENYWEATQ